MNKCRVITQLIFKFFRSLNKYDISSLLIIDLLIYSLFCQFTDVSMSGCDSFPKSSHREIDLLTLDCKFYTQIRQN